MKSTFDLGYYKAVIPHIQNIYAPEKDAGIWMYGFKYKSGVFEFIHCKTWKKAQGEYERLDKAINEYYLFGRQVKMRTLDDFINEQEKKHPGFKKRVKKEYLKIKKVQGKFEKKKRGK